MKEKKTKDSWRVNLGFSYLYQLLLLAYAYLTIQEPVRETWGVPAE